MELTCVECPMGCKITVKENGGKKEFLGYSCPRGKLYAENEVVDPKRVVTSTVKTNSGKVIPVKTDRPISKKYIFKVMEEINSIICTLPVNTGDIIKENVYGANIISAKTVK